MINTDPLWRRYEQTVRILLAAMDSNAKVVHNVMVTGRLSGVSRQVDVLARGTVVGLEISVACECKRYTRVIGIGTVDQFVGRLLDLGAERGVLYSYSSFSEGAVQRAFGSSNPNILLVSLEGEEDAEAVEASPDGPLYSALRSVDALWVDELGTEEYLRFLQTGRWW